MAPTTPTLVADTATEQSSLSDLSNHIANQKPFRFGDLPPELRDIIYEIVICNDIVDPRKTDTHVDSSGPCDLLLSSRPGDAMLALSQVSHSTRTESMAAYYSYNFFYYFTFPYLGCPLNSRALVWAYSWGERGAPLLRTLRIRCAMCHSSHLLVDFRYPTNLITPQIRPDCDHLLRRLGANDLNALALAILCPKGDMEVTSRGLLVLFRGLRGDAGGFASMDNVQRAAVLKGLETKVDEDKEYWLGAHGL